MSQLGRIRAKLAAARRLKLGDDRVPLAIELLKIDRKRHSLSIADVVRQSLEKSPSAALRNLRGIGR